MGYNWIDDDWDDYCVAAGVSELACTMVNVSLVA